MRSKTSKDSPGVYHADDVTINPGAFGTNAPAGAVKSS